MKRTIITAMALLCAATATAQPGPDGGGKHVLFIGNSYTSVNNLPEMVQKIAQSAGEKLDYDVNAPGGCTFEQHCMNQSMTLIRQGSWDAVVLQEQSQMPSFPDAQVANEVFPYAKQLVDSIYANNPCAEPMFYMTWGRKNGDPANAPFFPPLGSYEGMDSLLDLRYTQMAAANDAALCPVGRVWHRLRDTHPEIDLYQQDDSHPTTAGTYAAALSFYSILFRSDTTTTTFSPGLAPNVEVAIKEAVSDVVYLQLEDLLRPQPKLAVDWIDTARHMGESFDVIATNADSLRADWGDGSDTALAASGLISLSHTYADTGDHTITVVASRHCMESFCTWTFHATAKPADTEGIDNVKQPRIGVDGRRISCQPSFGPLTLYDAAGRLVDRGACSCTAPAAGIYLLTTGRGQTVRLALP